MAAVRCRSRDAGGWSFAMLHGYAHASEAPAGDPAATSWGSWLATALLHAVGLGLGKGAQRLVGDLGLRAMGGLVLAGGAWVLVAH
jgi:HupE / UreJ protein.